MEVEVEPTLTPQLNLGFTLSFLLGGLFIIGMEIWGVQRRKKDGDTITQNWTFVDMWLKREYPWFRWFFRVFTVGIPVWAVLHLIAGVS